MKGLTFLLFLLLITLNFCSSRSKSLIKDLPPDDQEFISKVNYIIKRHEKKEFLSLATDKERREFRINFWKKRDPDPSTEENEFRIVYFNRIREADALFSQGGSKGWLSDRGRVYILLGPPENKYIYPTGYNFYDRPSEVWYYGYFPIVFVDLTYSGNYELTPLGSRHIAEINKAQLSEMPEIEKIKGTKKPFDFTLKLWKNKEKKQHSLQIVLPYRNIIFHEGKNAYNAAITAHINIVQSKTKDSQSLDKDYTVTVKEEELDLLEKNYVINVPLKLKPGKYEVTVIIESKSDEIKVKNKIVFNIGRR